MCIDAVDVTVATLGGTSVAQTALSKYTFYKAPSVTGVVPTSASIGSLVTVSGSCLLDTVSVAFTPVGGGLPTAANFTNISTSRITAIVPPTLVTGTYDIQVTTPGGQTPVVPIDVFTVPL
ncbi:hypothetical protein OIU81_37310 (plasmid) [Streptomyces sp. NBC_01454]